MELLDRLPSGWMSRAALALMLHRWQGAMSATMQWLVFQISESKAGYSTHGGEQELRTGL
jgi:hypothetical protein